MKDHRGRLQRDASGDDTQVKEEENMMLCNAAHDAKLINPTQPKINDNKPDLS